MALDYIKTEFKKLTSIGLILVGSFLVIEHIYTYGKINFYDILGHEWFGILFIIGGLVMAHDYKNPENGISNALRYAKEKIKFVFNIK